jgi:hypothetical protein
MRVQRSGGKEPTNTVRDKGPLGTFKGVLHCDILTGVMTRLSSSNSFIHFHSHENGTPMSRFKFEMLGDKEMTPATFLKKKLGPRIVGSLKQVLSTAMVASTVTED